MKSLLDIQKDIRDLEKDMTLLSSNIKQINNDLDELRNQNNNIDFNFSEIEKQSRLIPFKKHPISRIENENTVQLYLELLLNLIRFDDNANTDEIDSRLVFIQWLLNNSQTKETLERLIIKNHKISAKVYDEISSLLTKKYKELFIVDLLIVANMNGNLNADECEYIADMVSIFKIDSNKLKTLAQIAKMVLCQKADNFDRSLGIELIKELGNYKHYVIASVQDTVDSMPTDIIKEAIKSMREIVVKINANEAIGFKWKVKQQEYVNAEEIVATYKKPKKKKGYYFKEEYTAKDIISHSNGTIFQFRENNVIYGVLSHEKDNKDSIKQWVKTQNK